MIQNTNAPVNVVDLERILELSHSIERLCFAAHQEMDISPAELGGLNPTPPHIERIITRMTTRVEVLLHLIEEHAEFISESLPKRTVAYG